MQRLIQVMMLCLLFSLTACQLMSPEPVQLPEGAQLGDKFYTQVTMQYEKGKYRTTNYRRGTLLAVNTEVELLDVTPKSIKVKLIAANQDLLIENVSRHTSENVDQAFAKLFAKTKVNLSQFSALEQKNIQQGTVNVGMSKLAVQVAIGYPPAIRTPSLESDSWTYWSNRFQTFIVVFEHDKVTGIQK
ncbi:hypothetical protein AU255_14220 [Methyloprofundus sedimenti]|uniref:Lipoprotein n=1 Tax=Methyloprofundus sedimenti TaxID=1420851 RepID=A0A1V8M3V3_9GAMM|nr:hypothetical protein [Methyloprofundus sedimenti]OQK16247.1 hypothetical protein AU255_14220 [Methyloprofundus sedimenti]